MKFFFCIDMTYPGFSRNDSQHAECKNMTLRYSNTTANNNTDFTTANWTVEFYFVLATFVTGTLSNGGLLFLFLKDRTLRTPFNVYLINLTVANFASVVTLYPLELLATIHSPRMLMSDGACTFELYIAYVVAAVVFNSHALIALNRTWTVIHPLSYRSFHSNRTAVSLCLGMWVFMHLTAAPETILDALYYRLPVATFGCRINVLVEPLRTYDRVIQQLSYSIPHYVMIVTLFVIVAVRMKRFREDKLNVISPESMPRPRAVPTTLQVGESSPSAVVVFHSATTNGHGNDGDVPTLRIKRVRRRRFRGLFLLTLLTISVTVCWTPLNVYYTLGMGGVEKDVDMALFLSVAKILFAFQMTVDPVLFALSMRNLRRAIKAQFT